MIESSFSAGSTYSLPPRAKSISDHLDVLDGMDSYRESDVRIPVNHKIGNSTLALYNENLKR